MDFSKNYDIKVPWELSRLQWLIPVGQAYLLTGDERYSLSVRKIVEDWIGDNPLGIGVNWSCTMEVALRSITLIWLFKVFYKSAAWKDNKFRSTFLKKVYLHGSFIRHNLEWSDVNGNHLTTNATGLVVIGLFFTNGVAPKYWSKRGGFHSKVIGVEKVGHIHFLFTGNKINIINFFNKNKNLLLKSCDEISSNMRIRGGGITSMKLNDKTDDLDNYFQIDVRFNTADSMGANFINSCLEIITKTFKNSSIVKFLNG